MDQASTLLLGSLIHGRAVATIATLHAGLPSASMIPFATDVGEGAGGEQGRLRFVTHVSRLAAHTRDMLESPEVCLLITAPESPGTMPQALPRVSIPARATFVDPLHADHAVLRRIYLDKFPEAVDLFQLGDFSIVSLEPTSARFVAGFGRAMTLTPAQVSAAVRGWRGDATTS
ncbi:MAG: hypothetical protein EBZ59_01525 [Planctomycetia bacterium]|nr:hypothetical protein [Planctomycetia bacterium]